MGQTDKAPSNPCYQLALSHADYEHDQVRVTPCYPGHTMNERWFSLSIGSSFVVFNNCPAFGHVFQVLIKLYDQKLPFLACSLITKQSCACMLGWGPRKKMGVFLGYIWHERRDKGVSRGDCRCFPVKEEDYVCNVVRLYTL